MTKTEGRVKMINREDMLELTRRMTPERACFTRLAGAYITEEGEIEDTFNINFLKLDGSQKAKNIGLAKKIPFSRTNDQLKEYTIPASMKGKDSIFQLLSAMVECRLKNDALLDVFYEQMIDAYPSDSPGAIFVFSGTYDVPLRRAGRDYFEESEEVYDFIICTIGPLSGEYEPGNPEFGFLYPAFRFRSADADRIDIYHADPAKVQEGLMYKLTGMRL